MRSLCLQELKLWRLEKGAKIVVFRYAEGCHHKRQLLCAMGPKVKGTVNTRALSVGGLSRLPIYHCSYMSLQYKGPCLCLLCHGILISKTSSKGIRALRYGAKDKDMGQI